MSLEHYSYRPTTTIHSGQYLVWVGNELRPSGKPQFSPNPLTLANQVQNILGGFFWLREFYSQMTTPRRVKLLFRQLDARNCSCTWQYAAAQADLINLVTATNAGWIRSRPDSLKEINCLPFSCSLINAWIVRKTKPVETAASSLLEFEIIW